MTHDRSNQPSDELIAKLVAKWMNWSRGCVPVKPGLAREKVVSFMEGSGDPRDECLGAIADPRTDTDAALELLRWVEMNAPLRCEIDEVYADGTWWKYQHADGTSDSIVIPISGQPFRTSVCWLAVDVLGVE